MKIVKRDKSVLDGKYLDRWLAFRFETGLYSEKARLKLEEFLHFRPHFTYESKQAAIEAFSTFKFDDIMWSFENGVTALNANSSLMYSIFGLNLRNCYKHYNYVTKDSTGQIIFYMSLGPYDYVDTTEDAANRWELMFNFRKYWASKNKKELRTLNQLHIMLGGRTIFDEDVPAFNEEEWRGVPFNPIQSGYFIELQQKHIKLVKSYEKYKNLDPDKWREDKKKHMQEIVDTFNQMMTI